MTIARRFVVLLCVFAALFGMFGCTQSTTPRVPPSSSQSAPEAEPVENAPIASPSQDAPVQSQGDTETNTDPLVGKWKLVGGHTLLEADMPGNDLMKVDLRALDYRDPPGPVVYWEFFEDGTMLVNGGGTVSHWARVDDSRLKWENAMVMPVALDGNDLYMPDGAGNAVHLTRVN